jgi:hypothetical protein
LNTNNLLSSKHNVNNQIKNFIKQITMHYDFVCQHGIGKRSLYKVLYLLAALPLLFLSCKKDIEQPVQADNPLTLSAFASDIVLNQRKAKSDAVDFKWTTGSNKGTNASILYTIELDKKGNNFAAPVSIDLGKAVYSRKFTNEILNDIVLNRFNMPAGTASEIEARVMATVSFNTVQPAVSNVVTIKVTPYRPVSATLYLIGDASPNGWDANKATPLMVDANDATTFTFQGALKAGDYKFITTLGQFLPSYNKGADENHIVLRTSDSQPDNKFTVTAAEAGAYKITVNLVDLTISKEKLAAPAYTRLWIVGDATPNGWNINNPNEMRVDPSDPFIFTYNEVLKAGEFKIPVATGNWGTDFFMPLVNHPDLNSTSVKLVPGGSPDNKWQITTPGAYKITLNIRENTISIKPFTPYMKLWMVGDATPNGWDIDQPNEMVKLDATNQYIFTYSGPLKAGEFKIPTATGNWGTDYFMPATNHQNLSGTAVKFVPGGSPDNKWQITSAGNYTVTFDQLKETISIVKQ